MNNLTSVIGASDVPWDRSSNNNTVQTVSKGRRQSGGARVAETDSEEDPEYNQEEFVRLRTSLHRKIEEAEARDRAKKQRVKNPCRKITQLFQRMFTSNSKRLSPDDGDEDDDESSSKNESRLPTVNLSRLKSPSSPNQKLGDLHSDSGDEEDNNVVRR